MLRGSDARQKVHLSICARCYVEILMFRRRRVIASRATHKEKLQQQQESVAFGPLISGLSKKGTRRLHFHEPTTVIRATAYSRINGPSRANFAPLRRWGLNFVVNPRAASQEMIFSFHFFEGCDNDFQMMCRAQ